MFTMEEFKAIALLRSSLSSTIWITKACRAGVSKALITSLKRLQGQDFPNIDDMQKRQRRQRERLNHGQGLGNDEYAVPIQAVDPDSGEGREDKVGTCPAKLTRPSSTGEPVSR